MKKILISALAGAIALTGLQGCSSDEPIITDGEATIFLSTALHGDFKTRPFSRATSDEELLENCIVWISGSEGVVRKYNGAADIPDGAIKLLSGNYVAEAWAGDSVPASFDARYFKGREEFTLSRGDKKSIAIDCHIANVGVTVAYDPTIDEVLSDYVFTVGHSQGSLDFVGPTDARGYFMMNSRDKDLKWTLRGTLNDGSEYTREGVITGAESGYSYAFSFKCTHTEDEIGGAYITIEVDESMLESEDVVVMTTAPTVRGFNFDINSTLRGEQGSIGRTSLWINASGTIESVIIASDYFTTLAGVDGPDFDLLRMTDDALRDAIRQHGIIYSQEYLPDSDVSTFKITFEDRFMRSLPDGDYQFKVDVTDSNGKTGTGTLKVSISNAPVITGSYADADIWTYKATVSGTIALATAENPVIKYRKYGTLGWTVADTKVDGTAITATITALEPATRYEYIAACDGYDSAVIGTFTTDPANQLPNSGFESWTADGKLWKIFAEGSSMFWDSGNPAIKQYQSFLKGNPPTYPDNSVKHSGDYSLCLNSINMVVKFAAGNAFIGEFLRTSGTNGVLGWGRAWTGRPVALKGYVKYAPAEVNYTSNDFPQLQKGDLDNGIIYIAMLDSSLETDDNGAKYPIIINTATKKVFDKDGANVIAYGELKFTQATAGDGLIEFEVPITYRRTDIKPAAIMCTMSASIGGDYFVGGEGSKMWIDDLELIYE